MRSSRRFWRSERGQSTAMVVAMLFTLILFVSVAADVGQAINRRIAVQMIADTGAYTGATVMAVGMNQLAYWNLWLQRAWAVYSWPMYTAMNLYFFPSCELADDLTEIYEGVWQVINLAYQWVNVKYWVQARGEAARVTDFNAADLFPSRETGGPHEELQYTEYNLSPDVNISVKRNILPTLREDAFYVFPALIPSEQVPDGTDCAVDWASTDAKPEFSYLCIRDSCGPFCAYPSWESQSPHVWWKKASDDPAYFVWIVTAPRTRALMFDWFLDTSADKQGAIPEMTAAAAARPVGGSIVDGESTYVAKMVPLSEVMWSPGGTIYDKAYSGPLGIRIVLH